MNPENAAVVEGEDEDEDEDEGENEGADGSESGKMAAAGVATRSGLHLNLQDLMKESENGEIVEEEAIPRNSRRHSNRMTMRSILRIGSLRDATVPRRTLWEVIQSENNNHHKCVEETQSQNHCSTHNIWRAMRHLGRSRDNSENEEQEQEQSIHLLADRSPSVLDSSRLSHGEAEASGPRVFLVAEDSNLNQESESATMDGGSNMRTRWRTLIDKLSLRSMACCGASLQMSEQNLNSATSASQLLSTESDDPETAAHTPNNNFVQVHMVSQTETNNTLCDDNREERRQLMAFFEGSLEAESTSGGMNLAAALAAERQLRAVRNDNNNEAESVPRSPFRVSLMSLLEEGDEDISERRGSLQTETTLRSLVMEGGSENTNDGANEVGVDTVCCVCMVRRKGAAFIPCGHTFCRFCTRELWVGRGSCPLCNRFILEILDIF